MENVTLGQGGILGLLGYATVFFGLIILMVVVIILGKFFMAAARKEEKPAPAKQEAAPAVEAPVAPGAAGKLKLYNVEPKTAAMVMAIVADKLQKPINELRFLSIKEVEE